MSSVFQPFPMRAGRRVQTWHYQPAFRRPKHFHEESEINLITRGRGLIQLGERDIDVRAGTLIWIPPGLDHYLARASEDFELLTIGFLPELLEGFAREHSRIVDFARPCQQLDENQAAELARVLGQTHETVDAQSIQLRSLEVLGVLVRLKTPQSSRLGYRAASFIAKHPTTSRDRLAQAMRSNRGDVSRQFHYDNGMTLRQYRNVLRTLRFLRFSDGESNNLAKAAVSAGFGSYSQCHRVFCALIGVSPRTFVAQRHQSSKFDDFEPLRDFLVTGDENPAR